MRFGMKAAVVICVGLISQVAVTRAQTTAPSSQWTTGDPIVTYWAGPGVTMPVNDQSLEELLAGGWNVAWIRHPEDLDLCARHGLRAMLEIDGPDVDDPKQAATLDALVSKVRNHPALYEYFITDEPGAGYFPKLGKLVAFLRERDPKHLAYINLLPTYAPGTALNVSDDGAARARVSAPQDFVGVNADDKVAMRYREYLKQFVDTVHPDLISYDHYSFMKAGDGPQYFLNLSLVRDAAVEAHKPFLNIIQACDSPAEGWREPTANEIRWLSYTSLAYGAQGISHFRYDTGFWNDPDKGNSPKAKFWAIAQVNREFVAIGRQLQPLQSIGAYHCGAVPQGGEPLPAKSAFVPDPASQNLLLGYFGATADRPTHVLVVNLDYTHAANVKLNGPGSLEVFDALAQNWHDQSGASQVHLTLSPGGGALVRLRGF